MNKIILSAAFLIISINGYAQKGNDHKWDDVTIYEYGMPLTDCESNFKNLFKNWPKFVANDQQTKLISYKYEETLTDSIQIDHYAKISNNWKSLGARVKGSMREETHGDFTIHIRKFYFYAKTWQQIFTESNVDSSQKDLYRADLENRLKIMRDNFKNKVQIGDKVYIIKLKIDNKKYDHYAICRPREYKIVYDNLFLKVASLPKYLLDKISPSE